MFDWIFKISQTSPIGYVIGLLALVCALGMALGSIKYKGIRLGSAGVLFVGILVASVSEPINKPTLDFVKEFGLVLFVFTIGLQLGPGFFASLRSDGVRLNILAAALVISAGILTPVLGWLCGVDSRAFAGLFAGASTNSPALGAAQQSFASLPNADPELLAIPALACAVSYPIAIAGLLSVLILLKVIYRIDPVREAEEFGAARQNASVPLLRRSLVLENPEFVGTALEEIYRRSGIGIIVSRIRSASEAEARTAHRSSRLEMGDVVLAVGTEQALDQFQTAFGRRSEEDLLLAPGNITYRRIIVTHKRALGQTVEQLGLDRRFGVETTRITRGDSEMTAVPGLRLQFGDVVQVVGTESQLKQVAAYLGNSLKRLNETQFIPLFAGIFLGVLVGSIPIAVPGLTVPLRIGLAGGPLIVALCLGRIGHIGGFVWHMPQSANHAFREFGVALFFAGLGLAAGDQFFAAVFSPRGLLWGGVGLTITVVPLLAISIVARSIFKQNFVTLGGMLSGAMTNPPALTFVSGLCKSESPTLAYATVYPLATLLRILVAQVLALSFGG
jgi:putative transport protein